MKLILISSTPLQEAADQAVKDKAAADAAESTKEAPKDAQVRLHADGGQWRSTHCWA